MHNYCRRSFLSEIMFHSPFVCLFLRLFVNRINSYWWIFIVMGKILFSKDYFHFDNKMPFYFVSSKHSLEYFVFSHQPGKYKFDNRSIFHGSRQHRSRRWLTTLSSHASYFFPDYSLIEIRQR